jgi:hypothetical protein
MHKGQEGANVKVGYEFGNDSMKTCCEHKTRMKANHRINILELCFYHVNCDFSWNIFSHEFLCLSMHIFFSFIVICTH